MKAVRGLERGRLGLLAAVGAALLLLAAAVVGGCVDLAGAPSGDAAYETAPATETEAPAATGGPPSTPSPPTIDEITPAAEPRAGRGLDLFGRGGTGEATTTAGGVPTVEELLEKGLYLAEASPAHLAIRGTASGDTVRCAWRGIARTTVQREDADAQDRLS